MDVDDEHASSCSMENDNSQGNAMNSLPPKKMKQKKKRAMKDTSEGDSASIPPESTSPPSKKKTKLNSQSKKAKKSSEKKKRGGEDTSPNKNTNESPTPPTQEDTGPIARKKSNDEDDAMGVEGGAVSQLSSTSVSSNEIQDSQSQELTQKKNTTSQSSSQGSSQSSSGSSLDPNTANSQVSQSSLPKEKKRKKKSAKKKKKQKDIFYDVLEARGNLMIGSQLSLTQESEDEYQSLSEILAEASRTTFRHTIEENANDPQLDTFVKACFRALPPQDQKSQDKRLAIYAKLFDLAYQGIANKRGKLFNFLVMESSNIPDKALAYFIQKVLNGLKRPESVYGDPGERWCPFEFFPSFLVRLLPLPQGCIDPEGLANDEVYSDMDGPSYARVIMDKVFEMEWPNGAVVMIVSTLGELSSHFSQDLCLSVIDKAFSQMGKMDYAQLPALVRSSLNLLTNAENLKTDLQVACLNQLVFMMEDLDKRYDPEAGDEDKMLLESDDEDEEEEEEEELTLGDEEKNTSKSPPKPKSKKKQNEKRKRKEKTNQEKEIDQEQHKILLHSEGAIISWFCMVISKHSALAKAFIKACSAMHGGTNKLSVFRTALLLGLARTKKLQNSVLDVFIQRTKLTTTLVNQTKDSSWIKTWHEFSEQADQRSPGSLDNVSSSYDEQLASHSEGLNQVLLKLIHHSQIGGWDSVAQSISIIGFGMIEAYNSYNPAHRVARDVRICEDSPKALTAYREEDRLILESKDPNSTIAAVGVKFLARAFSTHVMVQRDVLEGIRLRIAGAGGTNGILQIIRLAAEIFDSCSVEQFSIMSSTAKELIENLPKLSPRSAYGLISALDRFFKVRVDVVDFCILVLRKALFQRDVKPRLVAVQGLLQMIKHFPDGSNRVEQVQDTIHCIQRCLAHQTAVRSFVYQGLGCLISERKGTVQKSAKILSMSAMVMQLNTILVKPLENFKQQDLSLAIKKKSKKGTMKDKSSPKAKPTEASSDTEDEENPFTQLNDEEEASEEEKNTLFLDGFPFLVAEKCSHRDMSEPLYSLIRQLIRATVSKHLQAPATVLVDALQRRLINSDIDTFIEANHDEHALKHAMFCCEVFLVHNFEIELWEILCKLMRAYSAVVGQSSQTSSSSSSANLHKSKKRKKNNKQQVEDGVDDDEENASTKSSSAETLSGIPSGIPSCLNIGEILIALIKQEEHFPKVVLGYYMNAFNTSLLSFKETRRIPVAQIEAKVAGIDPCVSSEIAQLCALDHRASTPGRLVMTLSQHLIPLLYSYDNKSIPIQCLTALKEIVNIAVDSGFIQTLVQGTQKAKEDVLVESDEEDEEDEDMDDEGESTQKKKSKNKKNGKEDKKAKPTVDDTISFFCEHLFPKFHGKQSFAIVLLEILLALAPHSNSPLDHLGWLEEEVLSVEAKNGRFVEIAANLYISLNHRAGKGTQGARKVILSLLANLEVSESNENEDDEEEEDDDDDHVNEDEKDENAKSEEDQNQSTQKKVETESSAGANHELFAHEKYTTNVFTSVLLWLNSCLDDCEWIEQRVRSDPLPTKTASLAQMRLRTDVIKAAQNVRKKQESYLHGKLAKTMKLLKHLLEYEMPSDRARELLLRFSSRFFKLLGLLIKNVLPSKPRTIATSLLLLIKSTRNVSRMLDTIITGILNSKSNQTKISKEEKVVPNLVFNIEQYRAHLCTLARTVDLDDSYYRQSEIRQIKISFDAKSGGKKKKKKSKGKKRQKEEEEEEVEAEQQEGEDEEEEQELE